MSEALAPGRYRVRANVNDLAGASELVGVSAGATVDAVVLLEAASLQQIQTVIADRDALSEELQVCIENPSGRVAWSSTGTRPRIERLHATLSAGLYSIRVVSGSDTWVGRLEVGAEPAHHRVELVRR